MVRGADDLVMNLIPSSEQYEGWCFGTNIILCPSGEVCPTVPGIKGRSIRLRLVSLRAFLTQDRYAQVARIIYC